VEVPEGCAGHQVDGRNVAVRRVEVRNDLLQDSICLYTTSGLSDPSQVSLAILGV
jgi:hypothetical protein